MTLANSLDPSRAWSESKLFDGISGKIFVNVENKTKSSDNNSAWKELIQTIKQYQKQRSVLKDLQFGKGKISSFQNVDNKKILYHFCSY